MKILVKIDNKEHTYKEPTIVRDIISNTILEKGEFVTSIKSNDKFYGINDIIDESINLKILTNKHFESLNILRHSCAHLMSQAVYKLFPGVKSYVGPVIKDGFYYDFHYDKKFTELDLHNIENEMKKLRDESLDINKSVYSKKEASDE